MAVTQYQIDRTKVWGMQLSNLIDMWQRTVTLHDLVRAKMIAAGYGDSSATDGLTFGFSSKADALAAFAQVDAVAGDIGMPATSPTGTVNKTAVWAAIEQMIGQVG